MPRSLTRLKGAVTDDLDDIAQLVNDSFIERALNEGQRRYEPALLLQTSATLTWADGATQVTLPADFVKLLALEPDADSLTVNIPRHRIVGTTLYFLGDTNLVYAWSGRIFYSAHYPLIDPDTNCLLPDPACDGLVSYALYKVYKRIASNRTDYRKYSTLVNNATSVGDLLDIANTHLDDWSSALDATYQPDAPTSFYGD